MLRLGPYIWSPQIEPFLSYFTYRLYVDSASPEAFMTSQYTGFKFGLKGSTPLSPDGEWGIGGEFAMALNPSLRETPKTSGSDAKNNVVQFGVFGTKKLGERLKLLMGLDFEMYSSNFTGSGTRADSSSSASQKYTTLSGGVNYLF
ncbi:MAG: hypothetical protein HC902_03775 [Calothrix sp. SM1_5_4]|nr:hypothetical protein [Calothrix sp. SM1_5_4]